MTRGEDWLDLEMMTGLLRFARNDGEEDVSD